MNEDPIGPFDASRDPARDPALAAALAAWEASTEPAATEAAVRSERRLELALKERSRTGVAVQPWIRRAWAVLPAAAAAAVVAVVVAAREARRAGGDAVPLAVLLPQGAETVFSVSVFGLPRSPNQLLVQAVAE